MKGVFDGFDAVDLVFRIPKEVFVAHFISELGRTLAFSKLRCSGMSRMTDVDWDEVKEGYKKLGLEVSGKEHMLELAYALTIRAVSGNF